MFRKFLSRLFRPKVAPASDRPALRLEPLEPREVPAVNVWTGSAGPDFDTPGSWTLGHVAAAGEDLVFGVAEDNGPGPLGFSSMTSPDGEGGGVGGTGADCYGLHPPAGGGAYNSVTLEAVYVGKVTVTGGFSTGDLSLAGGTLDQPGGADIPYADTDITVTGIVTLDTENHHLLAALPANFTWTNGTLNSTSNLATLTVTGGTTTARFEPTNLGKTVDLGSSITLTGGAVGTMRKGTINLLNDGWTFNINANSGLAVDPGVGNKVNVEGSDGFVFGHILNIGDDAWVEVRSGVYSNGELPGGDGGRAVNQGGRLTLFANTTAYFVGSAGDNGYGYRQTDGTLVIWNGSKLKSDNPVRVEGGTLVTVGDDSTPGTATIECTYLYVQGGEVLLGRNPTAPYTHLQYAFSTLKVMGFVRWQGGTYRPFVLDEGDGSPADLWWSTGTFTVGDPNRTPALEPVAVNYEGSTVTPTSGRSWMVVKSNQEITKSNNNAPSYDTATWILVPVNNPVTEWHVKGK